MRWQSRSDTAGFSTPRIEPPTFLAIIWALTALSLLFLPARLYARWKTFHRFFWDDFFVISAWITSLAITASCTALNSVTYDIMDIGQGIKDFPPNIETITMQFARLFAIVPMIFYTGLWCIKIAFLIFFRRLGVQSVTSLHRLWWIVAVITMICYFACFASLPYRCALVSFEIVASPGCQTQGLSFVSMKVNCALDIVTDCLIMAIPFMILRRVRISTGQRVALSIVFSLVVITIVFAIVRAVITTVNVRRQMDPVWMYLWTSIELNVAIIVACVAPYRSLFIHHAPTFRPNQVRRSFKEVVAKMFTSSGGGMNDADTWSTAELPYLAPWVEDGENNDGNGEHGEQRPISQGEIPQVRIP